MGIIYPESTLNDLEINSLVAKTIEILRENKDWISLTDIYDKLKKSEGYHSLAYYHMYDVFPNSNFRLTRKYERGLGEEKIFLKYVQ